MCQAQPHACFGNFVIVTAQCCCPCGDSCETVDECVVEFHFGMNVTRIKLFLVEKPEVQKQLIAKIKKWKATLPEAPSGEVFSAERAAK